MNPQTISEIDDLRVADYRSLTDVTLRRRKEPAEGLFMAESHQVISRALLAGYPIRSVLTTPRWLEAVEAIALPEGTAVLVAAESLVNSITGYRVHRGALAAMSRIPLPRVEDVVPQARRIVVLEGVVDHTNVGAVFRSAAGLGFDAVLVDPTCADPLYRRSVRVSMGAVFSLPWTRTSSWPAQLTDLSADGWELLALTPRPEAEALARVAADPPERLALLLGSEGPGLSPDALAAVTRHVRIPMAAGVDSLNVGAAAAVACYALGTASASVIGMSP
ncbi:MAG: RNA methyltransferase [Actinomycetia bacterium]|nr:RNA methyltransferase [Actinomycetes bacterium]